jgi:hypothetical protein
MQGDASAGAGCSTGDAEHNAGGADVWRNSRQRNAARSTSRAASVEGGTAGCSQEASSGNCGDAIIRADAGVEANKMDLETGTAALRADSAELAASLY